MTFGRDPKSSKRSGTAGDATPAGRNSNEPNGGNPMDPAANTNPIPDGTPVDELIARRERRRQIEAAELGDNGVGVAMQKMWDEVLRFDGLGAPDPKPEPIAAEVDEALIGRVGDKVAGFRDEFVRELHHLDKHAPRRLYIEAQAMVSECDDFLATVAAHFREVGS